MYVFSDFFYFLFCRKKSFYSILKSDRYFVDVSLGISFILFVLLFNILLNRILVRKISRLFSAEFFRRDKDNGLDGLNVSSGFVILRLFYRDLEIF